MQCITYRHKGCGRGTWDSHSARGGQRGGGEGEGLWGRGERKGEKGEVVHAAKVFRTNDSCAIVNNLVTAYIQTAVTI